MATVQRRKGMFLEVLKALAAQEVKCDMINIAMSYDNFDAEVVLFLRKNFKRFHVKWKNGMTAEYKLYAMGSASLKENPDAYFITFDDDIIYPPDYSQGIIQGIEKYNREAVVGFHGIRFNKFPVRNYKAQKTMYQYFKDVPQDTEAHVIGTGCMGFYAKTLFDQGFDFPSLNRRLNCLDGAFGRWCRDNKVKTIVLKHEADWMKIYPDSQTPDALWRKSYAERYKTKLSFLSQ